MSDADHSYSDSTDQNSPDESHSDADDEYRDEADWGLDDLMASDEPVEKFVTLNGTERRLMVKEAADADAPDLDRQSEAEVYRAMAAFFRDHIVEPAAFADVTAEDLRKMRMGVSEKLLSAIVPETSDRGNLP